MDNKSTAALDYMLEKSAFINPIPGAAAAAKNVASHASEIKDVVKAVSLAGAGGTLAFMGLNSAKRKIQNDTRRKALIEDLYLNDPVIREADRDEVLQYYASILSVAPSVSLDKNVVRDLLQNFIKFGRVDLQTLKTLADTEKSIAQSKAPYIQIGDALRMVGMGVA